MSLHRIIVRLARNPDAGREADDHEGYTLYAPLTAEGYLDADAFIQHREACTVRRFLPDADPVMGRLSRHGTAWFFDYDQSRQDDDQPVYRLGQHRFVLGDYLTISNEDGVPLTYKITDVMPLA